MRAVIFPRVPPRSARVSPAVTHGAPPPEAALCGCESRGGRVRVSARLYTIRGDGGRRCSEWRVSARLHAIRGDGSRQSISARSPTVPGGDTLCLTAGDARRVNPWIGEELPHFRHRRCRTVAASAYPSFSLDAFSATPPVSEVRAVIFPRVPPRSARVSLAVTHGAPPPEAALCGCESRGGRVEWGESIRKTIYDTWGR